MRQYKKVIVSIFMGISLCFSSLGLAGCTAQKPATETTVEKALTAVESTIVKAETINKEMVYAGQISPSESVSVISKISGKVEGYYFDVGDMVRKGDVLFRLDKKDLQNQLETLNAQINQSDTGIRTAQNAINNVTGGLYQSQIIQQEATIENFDKQLASLDIGIKNAEINLENVKKSLENTQTTYDNAKALYEIEAMAKADFDKTELALIQAQSQLSQAENAYDQAVFAKEQLEASMKSAGESLDLTRGRITEDNLSSAQLALDSAMAARNLLTVQQSILYTTLNDTAVTAPMSGIISLRNAKENEYVTSQVPAYVIIDIEKVNVDVKVSELLINSIHIGQEVDVYISSISEEPLKGKIKTISPSADLTGTFPVNLELENEAQTIKPGMFAEIRFIKEKSENAIVLPRNTVLSDENNSFVYIDQNGTAKKTIVTTGIDNGEFIEIKEGINFGDAVITKGHNFIFDNEQINVVACWGE